MADGNEAVEASAKSGPSLIPLMVAMIVTVLGAVGGALFWLTRSGRLPVQAAAVAVAAAPVKVAPAKTKMIELDPLLVNLSDAGGQSYLRLVAVIKVVDAPPSKSETPKEEKPPEKGKAVVNEEQVMLRDTALAVLTRETSEQLLAPDGKQLLKQELREAFGTHVPDLKVQDVLFTEFLVQR